MKITTFVSGYSLNEQLTDHIDRHVRFALASVDANDVTVDYAKLGTANPRQNELV